VEYAPTEKVYVLDELLVWPDLRVTAHVFAEPWNDIREVGWINFRLIEWESSDLEGENPLYPTSPKVRGAKWAQSADAMVADNFAEGFLRWDGCMEIQVDHHMCGVLMYQKVATAILRLFLWAGQAHGFEKCEMEEAEVGQ
jgi:hypothetical protein